MDDIDPASGYDYSRRSYDRVRASWVDLVRQHGASPFYEVRDIESVRERWAEKRPEFLEGDDWLSAGLDEHRNFIAGLGRPCRKPDCLVHEPELWRLIQEDTLAASTPTVDELLDLMGISE